jgi:hypothetical protein
VCGVGEEGEAVGKEARTGFDDHKRKGEEK